jgi:hypothetical protein
MAPALSFGSTCRTVFRAGLETAASLAMQMFMTQRPKRLSPTWRGSPAAGREGVIQLALATIATGLLLTACGGATGGGATTGGTTAAAPEANNGEAQSVAYVDNRFHYRIDAPGKVTAAADGSAGFVGPTERITISVRQASSADLPGLARADIAALPALLNGFQLKSGPTAITLNGKPAEKFVFTYNAGASAVTGKALNLVGVRYYIPKDASTLAVVTYGIVADQYDPQGADDIASTFRWQ